MIRPAVAGDLEAIRRIVAAAYSPYIARIGREPGPMLDDYAARIRDGEIWVLDDGGVAGILVLLDAADHLLLDNVAVDPARRGGGLGRVLMGFAEQEAVRRGYRQMRLYTHALMTENRAMYPHLGWVETGRGEQAGFDRVFFRKDLS